jgi:hypothetical protein
MATLLHGAPSETAVTSDTLVCVCPCHFAGHQCICTVRIGPGEEYRQVLLNKERQQRANICVPCWTAINGEPCERNG